MDTTISAYHSADCPEVIRGVACSGGIGGREHSIVFPDVLHDNELSMHPFPQRDAYPSGCDGSRTRAIPGLQNPGLPPISIHPTILFWLGNRRPSGGRTDALCWLGASDSRGARPEPPFV